MRSNSNSKPLSAHEAAAHIGVTIRMMMRLIRSGAVPAVKVSGNKYLIDETELNNAIINLRRKQTEERVAKSSIINSKGSNRKSQRQPNSKSMRQSMRDNRSSSNILNIVAPSWDDL